MTWRGYNLLKYVLRMPTIAVGGTRWRSWLMHCATSRKVAGSIPDGVIGIFHWHNPSGRTMALGLTQPLTEWEPRIFSGGKGDRSVGLTTLRRSGFDCLEIWEPEHPGTLRACPGLWWDFFTFYSCCGQLRLYLNNSVTPRNKSLLEKMV
jgi:hypothetical protein